MWESLTATYWNGIRVENPWVQIFSRHKVGDQHHFTVCCQHSHEAQDVWVLHTPIEGTATYKHSGSSSNELQGTSRLGYNGKWNNVFPILVKTFEQVCTQFYIMFIYFYTYCTAFILFTSRLWLDMGMGTIFTATIDPRHTAICTLP